MNEEINIDISKLSFEEREAAIETMTDDQKEELLRQLGY